MTASPELLISKLEAPAPIGAQKAAVRLALRVSNLTKSFSAPNDAAIAVLSDISFSAVAGESLAIMGPSGAGKTTLLNIIGGLEPADAGTVSFDGETDSSKSKFQKRRISFVFQFHYLLPDLTVLENVSMPLLIERLPQKLARQRALHTLEEVGLTDRLGHKIGFLSGGEQQRVAVARALVVEPPVVLADEPTGNLDESIAGEIGNLLINYARSRDAIVLIATHNRRLADACDRALTVQQGRVTEPSRSGHS